MEPRNPQAGLCLSVVIPALNEALTIGEAIAAVPLASLQAQGFEVEILVVDNNSSDPTPAIAQAAGARLVYERRRGYGRALRAGFAAATGEIIAIADADRTYPLECLAALLRPILDGTADLVTGSRLRGRIEPGAMPLLHRYVGVPGLTFVLRVLFGIRVTDGHCGMRVLTRRAVERLALHTEGMEFATELLVRCAGAGLRIAEVPIDYRRRPVRSTSKLRSLRDGWRHLRFMLVEFVRSRRAAPREAAPPRPVPVEETSMTAVKIP